MRMHLLAYVDPGSGSYVIQVIVASVLAVGVSIRLFGKRIASGVRRVFSRPKKK